MKTHGERVTEYRQEIDALTEKMGAVNERFHALIASGDTGQADVIMTCAVDLHGMLGRMKTLQYLVNYHGKHPADEIDDIPF